MDDIFRDIKVSRYQSKLEEINTYHDSLSFTGEVENEGALPSLDAKLMNNDGELSSTWYCKPTDTGLVMNFHALAPMRYKRAAVIGFVHRIYRACSNWQNFHESLERAKGILQKNQYPSQFTDKIIHDTVSKIILCEEKKKEENSDEPFHLFVQYRGKCSEKYASDIKKTGVPVRIIFTLRKLKTVTPSLKEPVEHGLRSGIVYKLSCPRCSACYVGATSRHLQVRLGEHTSRKKGAVYKHLSTCAAACQENDMRVLCASRQGEVHLFTMEALWIRQLKPSINVKDEFKRRELVIKF